MRRLFILALLFLLMYALQFLRVGVETAFHPLSLATFGFVLLAAYTLGEITGNLGLPKITGYIVTGVIFGPYAVDLFSIAVVEDLKGINSLAIGLIALTAGGELKLNGLKLVARSIAFIVLFKVVLIICAISVAVLAIKPLIPFLATQSTALVLAVGVVFGILALGTSPAATIAVINETRSRGRLTDTTLGTAVVKDVVMVVLLALAIAVVQLYSTPNAVFESAIIATVGTELLFSLFAGAALGGIFIVYIRFVHAEMWLFIIGIVYFATAVAELLHLEALLMFITAGFVVQNFSRHGDELIHPIEAVSMPVYVVFFSIAGSSLDLQALASVWKIALILFSVRLLAIYLSTRFATAVTREPQKMQKNAWLSFISQAGVVLGLAIIVENNLPGIGTEIKTIVIATIAMNLLVGPVTFKLALSRLRETGEKREEEETEIEAESTTADAHLAGAKGTVSEVKFPEPNFPSPALNAAVLAVRADLLTLQTDFEENFIARQTAEFANFFAKAARNLDKTIAQLAEKIADTDRSDRQQHLQLCRQSRSHFAHWLLSENTKLLPSANEIEAARKVFMAYFAAIGNLAEKTESTLEIEQEEERFVAHADDTAVVRLRKFFKRRAKRIRITFGSGAGPTRVVDFRKLTKFHLAGKLPPQMESVVNLLAAQANYTLQKNNNLFRLIDDSFDALIERLRADDSQKQEKLDSSVLLAGMQQELTQEFNYAGDEVQRYGEDCKLRMRFALARNFEAFLQDLALSGTFELPQRKYRYSQVYETREKAINKMATIFEIWQKYNAGVAGSLEKKIHLAILIDNVSLTVDENVFSRSQKIIAHLVNPLLATKEICENSREHLRQALDENADSEVVYDAIAEQCDKLTKFIRSEARQKLERLRRGRELNAFVENLLQKFAGIAEQVPKECTVLDDDDIPSFDAEGALPGEAKLKSAPMQEITHSFLDMEVANDLANINQTLILHADTAVREIDEIHNILQFNLDAALDELQKLSEAENEKTGLAVARELAMGGIDRAIHKLETMLEALNEADLEIHRQSTALLDQNIKKLDVLISKRAIFVTLVQLKHREATELGQYYLEVVKDFVWHRLRLAVRFVKKRYRPLAREAMADIRTTLGLHEYSAAEILAVYDQARLDTEVMGRLPVIYHKLFDIAPLESSEFLIAREKEMNMVRSAKKRWQENMHSAVAVIGETGSGKTSFLNAIIKDIFKDARVHLHNFRHTITTEAELVREFASLLHRKRITSVASLREEIDRLPDNTVFVLEDAHKLFLRVVGGFEAIKKLLLLIAGTSDRILWILSIRQYSWTYLDKILGIADNFTVLIHTENLTRDELEQVILARHKVSGFSLDFRPDEVMQQRRKYRKASDDEKRQLLRWEYFDKLRKATDGNILAAIFYWLKTIGGIQDGELIIHPLRELQLTFLQNMQIEKLLTLGMITQHGSLSADEHAMIFGKPAEASLSILMQLANINLLTKEEDENGTLQFAINRLIYKPLARELHAMNILQ